jgi:hypothetical protein
MLGPAVQPAHAVHFVGVSGTRSHLRGVAFGVARSAGSATAVFTAKIAGNGECRFVKECLGLVVILDLDAVVGMDARVAWETCDEMPVLLVSAVVRWP